MQPEMSRIWDSHTGVTAVPSTTVDAARAQKGDVYANSVVIEGFFGKGQAKVTARGLAKVAAIHTPGGGPYGRRAAHHERLGRRDHRHHRGQRRDSGERRGH